MVWNKKTFFCILTPMLGLAAVGMPFLEPNGAWHQSLIKPAPTFPDWTFAALGGVCYLTLWLAAYMTLSDTRRGQDAFTYLAFCCLAALFVCLPYLYFEKHLLASCLAVVFFSWLLSISLLFRLHRQRRRSTILLLPAFFYNAYLIIILYGAVLLN